MGVRVGEKAEAPLQAISIFRNTKINAININILIAGLKLLVFAVNS